MYKDAGHTRLEEAPFRSLECDKDADAKILFFSCCLLSSWAVVCYYLIVSAHIIWVERRREGKGMGICISESPRLGSAVFPCLFVFHMWNDCR